MNTIKVKCRGRYEEYPAAAALYPGHLIELVSDGTVKKHASKGGFAERTFALEDALQGKTITQAYATADIVGTHLADIGDVVYARLPANAPAVAFGDRLISNGDGCLIKPVNQGDSLFVAPAASTALNSHTTITAFDVSHTLPANFLKVGDVLHIKATVLFANASNSSETVLITLKVGTLTIVATAALDNAAADIATIDAYVHVRAIGASGSIIGFGLHTIGAPGTATMKSFYTAAQTLDTTAAAAITINQTCSGSHANTGGQLVDLVVSLDRYSEGGTIAIAVEAVDNSAVAAEAFIKARVAA